MRVMKVMMMVKEEYKLRESRVEVRSVRGISDTGVTQSSSSRELLITICEAALYVLERG
jgi:hypothetical protein